MSNPFPTAGQNPFAEQPNPYAAPREATEVAPQLLDAAPFAGLWRQGNLMVMHKHAPLPDICLKSNLPATHRLKRSLSWHHPALILLVLIGVLIYAIVALIVRKTATIQIPLTEEWFHRRRRRMIFAWSMFLSAMALIPIAAFYGEQADWAPVAVIAAILLMIGAAIYGLVACRLVSPNRMTDTYIWLKGVHPDYLDRLEPWTYNL